MTTRSVGPQPKTKPEKRNACWESVERVVHLKLTSGLLGKSNAGMGRVGWGFLTYIDFTNYMNM